MDRSVQAIFWSAGFLLSTDLQVGEQTAVLWIQRNVEPHFFSGVFEYRPSVLIGDSNTGWLDQHSLGIRQLKNRIAGFESHEKSIRLILTNNSPAKTKQFANVKTFFFNLNQAPVSRKSVSQAQNLVGRVNRLGSTPGVTSSSRDRTLEFPQHIRRFRQDMRGVPQEGQQPFALRNRRDAPGACRLVFKRQNPANRCRGASYRSIALARKYRKLRRAAVPEEQRPRIWMDTPLCINQRILIGKINGASTQQFGDQR
jgi:hypothetical protein